MKCTVTTGYLYKIMHDNNMNIYNIFNFVKIKFNIFIGEIKHFNLIWQMFNFQ